MRSEMKPISRNSGLHLHGHLHGHPHGRHLECYETDDLEVSLLLFPMGEADLLLVLAGDAMGEVGNSGIRYSPLAHPEEDQKGNLLGVLTDYCNRLKDMVDKEAVLIGMAGNVLEDRVAASRVHRNYREEGGSYRSYSCSAGQLEE